MGKFSFDFKVVLNPNLEGDLAQHTQDMIQEDFIDKVIYRAKDESPHVTGHNKEQITARKAGKAKWNMGTIGKGKPGVKTRYGGYLELGTAKMPAQPYFAPAIKAAFEAMKRKYG